MWYSVTTFFLIFQKVKPWTDSLVLGGILILLHTVWIYRCFVLSIGIFLIFLKKLFDIFKKSTLVNLVQWDILTHTVSVSKYKWVIYQLLCKFKEFFQNLNFEEKQNRNSTNSKPSYQSDLAVT